MDLLLINLLLYLRVAADAGNGEHQLIDRGVKSTYQYIICDIPQFLISVEATGLSDSVLYETL